MSIFTGNLKPAIGRTVQAQIPKSATRAENEPTPLFGALSISPGLVVEVGHADFYKSQPLIEGGGGYLVDRSTGRGVHVTGTDVKGNYVGARVTDRAGRTGPLSESDPMFGIGSAEDLITMFDLKSVPGDPESYTRPNFSGTYSISKRSDGWTLFYSGGVHSSGLSLPPQAFHLGRWDTALFLPPKPSSPVEVPEATPIAPIRPSSADIFSDAPVAQGTWNSIGSEHSLTTMNDGNVLDLDHSSGKYRLYTFDPKNAADVLPGPPLQSETWGSIRTNHELVPMPDGRVLDFNAKTGAWRLYNYDASNSEDILPAPAVAEGEWSSIKGDHKLIPMRDGTILDWCVGDGKWRLYRYDASNGADILPGPPLAEGQWSAIKGDHALVPMRDGTVLDMNLESGEWRLYRFSPQQRDDILPEPPLATGQSKTIKGKHRLTPMHNGMLLDLDEETGDWRLWNFIPPARP